MVSIARSKLSERAFRRCVASRRAARRVRAVRRCGGTRHDSQPAVARAHGLEVREDVEVVVADAPGAPHAVAAAGAHELGVAVQLAVRREDLRKVPYYMCSLIQTPIQAPI